MFLNIVDFLRLFHNGESKQSLNAGLSLPKWNLILALVFSLKNVIFLTIDDIETFPGLKRRLSLSKWDHWKVNKKIVKVENWPRLISIPLHVSVFPF